MLRAAIVARWFVITFALATGTACGPSQSANAPAGPTANVPGTVAAQVQATVQTLSTTRNDSPTTPPPVQPSTQATPTVDLPIVLDEHFVSPAAGWLNDPNGVAWREGDAYHLVSQTGLFVALGAPLTGALGDAVVSATFRKVGGPPGGGYGVVLRDQNPDSRDGTNQGGRFIVAEIGDEGTIGIWRREVDHWVDLVPWTQSPAVHTDVAANDLTVQTLGDELTMLVNGTQVGHIAMGLPAGGVGVFVGGDGNEVVLQNIAVRSATRDVRLRPTPPPPTIPPTARPATPPATAKPAPPTPTTAALAKVGDSAQAGNWAIQLEKVETAQVVGSQSSRKQAQGIFVVVTISAANLHNQTSTLNSWDFQMLGSGNVTYAISSDGSSALVGQEPTVLWLSEQIQPGLTKSFRLVFDVNPAVKNYVFEAAKIRFSVSLP